MRGMRISTIRLIVGIVCTGSVAGMIVSAILGHIGAVVSFGSVAAVAIIALMAATLAVVAERRCDQTIAESASRDLEESIARLGSAGVVTEVDLRDLARTAVRLGSSIGHSQY